MFKKLSLELGGKNPNIIFADCDFEQAVASTMQSSFANQGEICLCGSRILVERSIYQKFVDELVKKTKALVVGDPSDDKTNLGALVSEAHMNKVLGYIKLAKEEGGEILTGGNQINLNGGYYLEPTVVVNLPQTCRTNQEEIFGPFVTVSPFDTEAEAIEMANSNTYGLSGNNMDRKS